MNLSLTFDTINHDLLLAKLLVYRFSKNAINLVCSYLKKIENTEYKLTTTLVLQKLLLLGFRKTQ